MEAAADLEAANAALREERRKVLARSKMALTDQNFPAVLSPDVFDNRPNPALGIGSSTFDSTGITFTDGQGAEYSRRWEEVTLYRNPVRLDDCSNIVLDHPGLPNARVRNALGPQVESLLQIWFNKDDEKDASIFIGLPGQAEGQEFLMELITNAGKKVAPFPTSQESAQSESDDSHFETHKRMEGDTSPTLAKALVLAPTIWDSAHRAIAGVTDERFFSVPLVVGEVPGQPNVRGVVLSVPWSRIGDFTVLPGNTGWISLRVLTFQPGVAPPATLKQATEDPRSLAQLAMMIWGTQKQEKLLEVLEEQINLKGCFTQQERSDSKTPWW